MNDGNDKLVLTGLAVTQILADALPPKRVIGLLTPKLVQLSNEGKRHSPSAKAILAEIVLKGGEVAKSKLSELRNLAKGKADKEAQTKPKNGGGESKQNGTTRKALSLEEARAEWNKIQEAFYDEEAENSIEGLSEQEAKAVKSKVSGQRRQAAGRLSELALSSPWKVQKMMLSFLATAIRGKNEDIAPPLSDLDMEDMRRRLLKLSNRILSESDVGSRQELACAMLQTVTEDQEKLAFSNENNGCLNAITWVEYIAKMLSTVDPGSPLDETQRSDFEECRQGLRKKASKAERQKAIAVLTDLLLGVLVSNHDVVDLPTHLAFKALEDDLTLEGWKSVIDVVAGTSIDGLEVDESDMDDDVDGDSGGGNDDDGSSGLDEEDSDGDKSHEKDDNTEEGESNDENEQKLPLEAQVKANSALLDALAGVKSEGQISEDEASADDEEMMKNDENLAADFRAKRAMILASKQMAKQAEHFRLRALKLVNSSIKRNPSRDVFPRILTELYNALRACMETDALKSKALEVAESIAKCKATVVRKDEGKALMSSLDDIAKSVPTLGTEKPVQLAVHFIRAIIGITQKSPSKLMKIKSLEGLVEQALSPSQNVVRRLKAKLHQKEVRAIQKTNLSFVSGSQNLAYTALQFWGQRSPGVVAEAMAPRISEALYVFPYGDSEGKKDPMNKFVINVATSIRASDILLKIWKVDRSNSSTLSDHIEPAVLTAFIKQAEDTDTISIVPVPVIKLYGAILNHASSEKSKEHVVKVRQALKRWRRDRTAKGILPTDVRDLNSEA